MYSLYESLFTDVQAGIINSQKHCQGFITEWMSELIVNESAILKWIVKYRPSKEKVHFCLYCE